MFKSKLFNCIYNIGFKSECADTSDSLDVDDESTYSEHRAVLEMYGFILYWFIISAEDKAASRNDANGRSVVRAKVYNKLFR